MAKGYSTVASQNKFSKKTHDHAKESSPPVALPNTLAYTRYGQNNKSKLPPTTTVSHTHLKPDNNYERVSARPSYALRTQLSLYTCHCSSGPKKASAKSLPLSVG